MSRYVLTGLLLGTVALIAAMAMLIREDQSRSDYEAESSDRTSIASPKLTYRLLRLSSDGTPVRWNPCEPIRYVLNPQGTPDGVLSDLAAAVSRTSQSTSLTFLYEGTTDEAPAKPRNVFQPNRYGDRWSPVLVAWVHGGENDVGLLPNEAGRSSPVAVEADARSLVNVSGHMFLNSQARYPLGFDQPHSWGHVLLHELGHLVGLDDVNDPTQVMHQELGEGALEWGAGDLVGLGTVGGKSGCLQNPDPRPVEIEYSQS